MKPWRIVFMGTPEFAVPTLAALAEGPDPLVGVFTQPDKPGGRGMKPQPSPVKSFAEGRDIPVFQPHRMRLPEAVASLQALEPDLVVVIAYGQILPVTVLTLPKHGCVNVHASLLPRWRGAAPIHRALLAGDPITGITTMQMDEGLDTGTMLLRREVALTATTTGGQLHDQLAQLGAELMLATLAGLKAGTLQPTPQPGEGVTYAHKLTKEEARLDWQLPAPELALRIRAFHPWPAAFALLEGEPFKILTAQVAEGSGPPGQILALAPSGPIIACGQGSLLVTEVQPAGKRRMSAAEWLRGRTTTPDMRLT